MKKLPKGFLDERDSGSALTFFLVRKVTDGGTADNGVTNAKEGVSLIADSRSDSTMAHEAGHSSELSMIKANTIRNTVIRRRARRC